MPDEFDTLIQDIKAAPEATRLLPKPVPVQARQRVQQPHRVIWFEWGTILFLVIAILLYLFLWLLLHS